MITPPPRPPVLLGVNIDHIATLREVRGTRYPEPMQAALLAEQAGADAITIHLREDRRHIQERDVRLLRDVLQTRMNLEMAATAEMARIASEVQPHDCCLVPERRAELTTEGGLDVAGHRLYLTDFCSQLTEAGIRVSLFIAADPPQIEAAAEVGAPVIELHTGHFADATSPARAAAELERLSNAAQLAHSLGLYINAGHGLNYYNVAAVAALAPIRELNIGHAIIAQAVFSGLAAAVYDMKLRIRCATHNALDDGELRPHV